ncbi:Formyltransferase, partial [Rhizodiscina lignyota]
VDPLRILFCGSDSFSIASLNALYDQKSKNHGLISSIDVVCRPGKRVGRGLKEVREVPIKQAAQNLELPIHEIDTFTGWQPPVPDQGPINLIIAVSFGLFIPPRILGSAQYGGINVHPSILPDLRGPAPIQHAIIRDRESWGVTVQTLHPKHFDQGTILFRERFEERIWPRGTTPKFAKAGSGALYGYFERQLATLGAQSLIRTLEDRLYIEPPAQLSQTSNHVEQTPKAIDHASKIGSEDRRIDW